MTALLIGSIIARIMSAILVIANPIFGPRLRADLESLGHEVRTLETASLAEIEAARNPDLVMVDGDAAGEGLSEVCRALRTHEGLRRTPILAIAGPECVRSLDFSSGLDDFLARPYDLREMEVRIRIMLWRDDRLGRKDILKAGDILINLARYEVRVRGALIELTLKEYELLKYLVLNRGRVFTRGDLLNRIWGYDYYGGMRTVDVHIRRVRSKLEGSGEPCIKTIRGVGYRFEPPIREDEG